MVITGDYLETEMPEYQALITSPVYPELRGCRMSKVEWLLWFARVLGKVSAEISPDGVAVFNIDWRRNSAGFFDLGFYRDLLDLFIDSEWSMIDIEPMCNKNPPPRGDQTAQLYNTPGWERVFLLARNPEYKFNWGRKPYAPKSLGKLKNGNRARGATYAGGHSRQNPLGARIPNWFATSPSAGKRPRIGEGVFSIETALRYVPMVSSVGDTVADIFCGSGTVLVGAQRLGRIPVGCDINPQNAEVSRQWLIDDLATAPTSS